MNRFGTFLDHTIPRLADQTLVLRAESAPILEGFGARKVTTVLPGISPKEFTDLVKLKQQKPVGMETGQWVVYAGNPDSYQNLEVLIAAMDCLPNGW